MRKVLFILACLVSIVGYTQSVPKLLRYAQESYDAAQYLTAIQFYEKAVKIDKENYAARFQLGTCYSKTLQNKKAKKVFKELGKVPNQEFQARSLYNYANILKEESEFEVADSLYNFLITIPDTDQDLISLSRRQREGCLLAIKQSKQDRGFRIEELKGINSKFYDFGATINPNNDHVVFATTRNLPGVQYEGRQFDGVLPDLVSFERRTNNKWRNESEENRFQRLNTQWSEGSGSFTRDGKAFYFSSCRGEEGSNCRIMVSYLENNNWSKAVPLNEFINEKGSENKQPYVTPKGDTLFFTSDRPGGIGGSDIWMSLRGIDKDSWTPAINLGEAINSSENEITPYYSTAYSTLIFASNGHVGYGGFDIYAAKGASFFEPEIYHLGLPFNSTLDDTYFTICDTVGFMATNREDTKILNLYSFKVSNERLFLSLLLSGESLIDAKIASRFRGIRSLDLVTFRVEDYQGFELFEPETELKADKQRIRASNETVASISDGLGSGNKAAQTLNVATQNTATPLRSEFEKLYFSYDLFELEGKTRAALDVLASALKEKRFTKINILAYTDQIGQDKWNTLLSKKRGLSVKNYLISKGIKPDQMEVFARGELKGGDDEHWFNRILNRRVEIAIDAEEPLQFNSATNFIVRRKNTLQGAAAYFGVSYENMKKWNNLPSDDLYPGSTIRVYPSAAFDKANTSYFVHESMVKANFSL